MSEGEAVLCEFTLDSERVRDTTPCVREEGHDGRHVVALSGRKSAVLYEVNVGARTLQEICHARVDGPLDHQECAAMYALLELSRERGG